MDTNHCKDPCDGRHNGTQDDTDLSHEEPRVFITQKQWTILCALDVSVVFLSAVLISKESDADGRVVFGEKVPFVVQFVVIGEDEPTTREIGVDRTKDAKRDEAGNDSLENDIVFHVGRRAEHC